MAHQSTEHVPPEYCLHLEHMSPFWAAVSGGMPAVGNTGLPLHSVAGGLSQRATGGGGGGGAVDAVSLLDEQSIALHV